MIDTLRYTRELEKAGFNSEQAEKVVRAQIDMITTSVATKADLQVLEARMDVEFTEIRSQFKDVYRRFDDIDRRFEDIDRRFEDIDRRLGGMDLKMDSMENRITFRLIGAMVLLLTIFTYINEAL